MVLFDASPIFVAFPGHFPLSSVSGPGGGHGQLCQPRISGV